MSPFAAFQTNAAFEEVHNSLLYITFDIVIIVNLMPIA
jgi:hypothetical protein